MDEANQSEVARLRGQIRAQYQAARWAITGLAAVAQHQFITARFREMDEHYNELTKIVGEKQATQIVIEITDEKQEGGEKTENGAK